MERFDFGPLYDQVSGFDEEIARIKRGNLILEIGWDIWSGFYVFADDPQGDLFIKELGDYINPLLKREEYQKFIQEW